MNLWLEPTPHQLKHTAKRLRRLIAADEPEAIHQLRAFLIAPPNKPHSWRMIEKLSGAMTGRQFWRYIFHVWTGIGRVDVPACIRLFDKFKNDHDPALMPEHNRRIYEAIPDGLLVYRGQSADVPLGLSWSTSKGIASYYSSSPNRTDAAVFSARISKKDVAAVFSETGERELVLFSPSLHEVTRSEIDPADAAAGHKMILAHNLRLIEMIPDQ